MKIVLYELFVEDFIILMSSENNSKEPLNCLVELKTPERPEDDFYEKDKDLKTQYGEVWGSESHGRRRKMILEKHPEVQKLLLPDKPYSILLVCLLVPLHLGVIYLVKVVSF